ncbi:MAG: valine--tRNA ligase [Patescibacteria group bacterium]|nr:valine--tRNA ligase [Patescibacteria group bacterium]
MSKLLTEKYNFERIENQWKKFWEDKQLFKFRYNNQKPFFVVDTPPPYVSADHLHAGHIMSYAQAEFIVRYKRMRGYNVFYPMGFDDNGLPTERFVEKKYNLNKGKIKRSEFIKICLKETKKGSLAYKKLWNDLGISVDWSKTYSTISPLAVKVSQRSIIDLYKKKALYRGESPILWCPSCRTAIAQADLEDVEIESQMNYLKFKSGKKGLIIATTRPELLPACVALYINPGDKRYTNLVGKKAQVPLFKRSVPIKTSSEVVMDKGTGIMMVCTWGDQEDLAKWKTDKLDTRHILEQDGRLNKLGGKYQGLKIKVARQQIIDDLKKGDYLIKQESIKHSVNVHERCGTPVELIPSKQWFIRIINLKKKWLEYKDKLNWHPARMAKDYQMWVDSLKWDWCVSRQRYYGVPFPLWYCAKCKTPIFATEKDLPVNPIEEAPSIKKCPKCGHTKFEPETDVLDTWATSSCTPFLLKELVRDEKVKEKLFPATLRPNAFEIIRTWDFYSIVKSHYHFGKLPFKNIMISGHGQDEQGRKFSKRLNNYDPSDKLLKNWGADAIRYWATGSSLGQNLRFNPKEVKKGKRTTTKLWNVGRFLAINSEDSTLKNIKTATTLEYADIWIIEELNKTIQQVTEAFENYAYAKAKNELDSFFWSKLADYYIEFIKYRLNGDKKESRDMAQTTLSTVFLSVLKMYAPLLPFITEEIYQDLFKKTEARESIHISDWPKIIKIKTSTDIKDFQEALDAINEIRKYKTTQGISLGFELEEYSLKTKVNLPKYQELIKNAIKVKQLLPEIKSS